MSAIVWLFVLFFARSVLLLLTISCERIFMLLPTCQCLPNCHGGIVVAEERQSLSVPLKLLPQGDQLATQLLLRTSLPMMMLIKFLPNLPIPTELLWTAVVTDYVMATYVCNCLIVLFCFLFILTFSCERIFMLLPTCQCLANVMEE
jgi:hypothetical protein